MQTTSSAPSCAPTVAAPAAAGSPCAEQLDLWPDAEAAARAELAIIGAAALAEELPASAEVARRRSAVLSAANSLCRALAAYLESAGKLGQPAALPPGVEPEQLPARWAEALGLRLQGQLAARQAAGLPTEAHAALLATLRTGQAKRRTGGRRPEPAESLPTSTLAAIWSAMPDGRRLPFVMSLTDEAADRLLGHLVSLPRPEPSAPSARCAAD